MVHVLVTTNCICQLTQLVSLKGQLAMELPSQRYHLDWQKDACHLQSSLHFNGHFPGERGLAVVYWSKGWKEVVVTTGAISSAKLQSNHHHQQHPVFLQARWPSCRPTNSVKAPKGKISHSMDLPKAHLGSSNFVFDHWLPWGSVAMPLISPLMPVPQHVICSNICKTFPHDSGIPLCCKPIPCPCGSAAAIHRDTRQKPAEKLH